MQKQTSRNREDQKNTIPWGDDEAIFYQYYDSNRLQDVETSMARDQHTHHPDSQSRLGNHLVEARNAESTPKEGHSYKPHKSGGPRQNQESPSRIDGFKKGISSPRYLKGAIVGRGPISIIITIVLSFGSIVGMFFSTPATLFASIKANITNARDTSGPVRNIRFTRIVSNMMPGSKYGDIADKACGKPKSKMCRALTMSEKMQKRLEKAGIKVEHEKHEKSGRLKIKSITVEDRFGRKYTASNKQQLRNLFKHPVFRSSFNRGYDAMKTPFLGKHFKNLLSKRFGINKGPGIDGKNKKELDKSFRQNMKLEGEPADGDPEKRKKNRENQTKKVKGKIDVDGIKARIKGVVGTLCSIYQGTKATMSVAKSIQILNLVRFAMSFLIEFDRAIATESTPEVVSYIGSRLNYSERNEKDADGKPNRFYNTTFADAEGMRMLLHGDLHNLSDFASRYIVGGGVIGEVNKVVTDIEEYIGGAANIANLDSLLYYLTGRSTSSAKKTGQFIIEEVCVYAGAGEDFIALQACTTTMTPPLTAIAAIVGFGIGGVTGPIIAAGLCGALFTGGKFLVDKFTAEYIDDIIKKIAEWASEMPLDEETVGYDAGNALAAGAGLLLQNSALSNGLVATDIAGYRKFLSNIHEEQLDYIAAHKFDAKGTPLDTTNQHSFLGSIALTLHQNNIRYHDINPINLLKNSIAVVPLAARQLNNINQTAHALGGVFNTIPPFDDREAKCPDPILTDDFAGDPFCVPYTHMASRGLSVDSVDLIKYMEDNEFIDKESGSPLDTDNGKILRKFNKYCVSRTLPPGELDPGGSEDGNISNSLESTEAESAQRESEPGPGFDLGGLLRDRTVIDWQSGFNCSYPNKQAGTNEEMLAMLSAYTMDSRIHDDMEDEGEKEIECEIKSEEVVGDSIANGYAKQAGLDDGLTEVGRNPKKIYESIQSKTFESGTHIYLSTGLSNDVNDTEHASKTISTLAGQEGVSITLFGVANQFNIGGKTGKELNDWLKQEAEKYPNVTFTGGFDAGSDNVHSTNYDWVPKVDKNCGQKGEGGSGEWARPTTGVCSSGFGQRWGTLHAGLDIAPPTGTPILAPTKMKIISSSDKGDGYGNSVVARQVGGEGYMFRFGHAQELKTRAGEEVDRSTIIATVGSTGQVTGPHLHFEIYDPSSPDGAYAGNGKPLDPHPILKDHGVDVGACTPNSP